MDEDLRSVMSGARDMLSLPAERLLQAMVSPRDAEACPRIDTLGGYAQAVLPDKAKAVCQVAVGTNGVGFCAIGFNNGPSSNLSVCRVSDATYTGTQATQIPGISGATPGVSNIQWGSVPYLPPGGINSAGMQFRTVAGAAYVSPEGSANSQNGNLYLLELPGHCFAIDGANMSFTQAMTHERTRHIKGVQLGDPTVENVLNWHPVVASQLVNSSGAGPVNSFINENAWAPVPTSTGGTPDTINPSLLVVVTGLPGAIYNIEIHAIFELRGYQIAGAKPPYYDSRGQDLIFNALAHKMVSGWVGRPQEAEASYKHQVVRTAQRADDVPDGVAELPEGHRENKSVWNDLFHMAKEVAGFVLPAIL